MALGLGNLDSVAKIVETIPSGLNHVSVLDRLVLGGDPVILHPVVAPLAVGVLDVSRVGIDLVLLAIVSLVDRLDSIVDIFQLSPLVGLSRSSNRSADIVWVVTSKVHTHYGLSPGGVLVVGTSTVSVHGLSSVGGAAAVVAVVIVSARASVTRASVTSAAVASAVASKASSKSLSFSSVSNHSSTAAVDLLSGVVPKVVDASFSAVLDSVVRFFSSNHVSEMSSDDGEGSDDDT